MHRFDAQRFGLGPQPVLSLRLQDAAATRALGARLAGLLRDGGFVGLVGELGAGKTTLVQGLLEVLAPGLEASSPTYTLLNEYDARPRVYHFDLYRLENADELETVAYWDYAEDEDAIVLVEWIDRVPAAWFGRGAIVELSHANGERIAAVWASDPTVPWSQELDDLS